MLNGKVAVITGGTRGIGLATAKKYLENKAVVVLWGSRAETVEKALEEIKAEYPEAKVEGGYPDLLDQKAVEKALQEIKNKHGSLDILVNNAGISSRTSVYDYEVSEFDRIVDLNIKAAFLCSQAAAAIMKEQGGGVILNTSSMVSLYGQSRGCAYPASKFALNGMTKSLARELGRDHIRVNAVAPGVVNTDMVAALPKEIIQPVIDQIPLGRMAESEDIANAFLFLASDMASYITGVVLSVDGASMT